MSPTHRKVSSPPAKAPLNQWLIVQLTEHPEICTRLALSFPDWTIALVGVKSFSDRRFVVESISPFLSVIVLLSVILAI
jgi:hypothetical protein